MATKYKKRKDGRYAVQIQVGYKEDGKPKYKSLYARTQPELEKKERDFRQNLEKGIIIDDEGLTVEQWAERWLELYKSNLEYNTIEMYRIVVDAHIVPEIGHIKLKNLKTFHVQELINKKAVKSSVRTLEKIKITMGQIVKQAIINEFIYKDIMIGVELPKKQSNEKRALTDNEIEIIKSADLPLKEKTFVLTLLYTGLRRGEILALTKNDIDLKTNTLTVNKAMYFEGNNPKLKDTPKSKSGIREIPIPKYICNYLRDYMTNNKNLLLFPSATGNMMTNSVFRRFWDNIIKAIENQVNKENIKIFNVVGDITPHIFRHTYATILYKSNVDMKTAQVFLGHSTIQVTMDIYTHLDNEKRTTAKNKINNFIDGKKHSKVVRIRKV